MTKCRFCSRMTRAYGAHFSLVNRSPERDVFVIIVRGENCFSGPTYGKDQGSCLYVFLFYSRDPVWGASGMSTVKKLMVGFRACS